MTLHQRRGASFRVADVESADYGVDAGGCDGGTAVLVPVVGEAFGGWVILGLAAVEGWCWAVDWD
jgi:hypothetical protein